MSVHTSAKALLSVVCGSLLLASCAKHQTPEDTGRPGYVIPDTVLKTLVIDTVTRSEVTAAIKFNGIVDFNTDKVANIFPLVSGNIQNITVRQGDYVKAGQVLGVIKSAEVANYNSALITAETNEKLNQTLLARQQEMAKNGLASQLDVTTAKVNYEQAVAARIAAQKVLNINGSNNTQGDYIIKSPIEGFVVQKNVTNGMAIRTDNTNALFVISDLKDVWVQANVYEANINNVHEGDEADVTTITNPDRIYTGHVDMIMNTLDPTNRVMKMRVILPNPDYSLKPQMFATITVHNDMHETAISVPSSALIFDNSQYYVLVYQDAAHVQITQVDLISNNGKVAYIRSGVAPGQRVIASQAILIYGALNN